MKKDISAIIPAYNAEKYLADAIESILCQTQPPSEILVLVDEGSTDNTAVIAGDYSEQVNVISHEHCNLSQARNRAISLCYGSILAFLDADDIWPHNHIELLYSVLEKSIDLEMVSGHVEQFISPEIDQDKARKIPEGQQIMQGYLSGSSLIKKSAFEKAGLYDESLTLAESVDWFSRARAAGVAIQLIPEVVLKRRLHSGNMGIREKSHMKDYTKVLFASIKRERMNRGR